MSIVNHRESNEQLVTRIMSPLAKQDPFGFLLIPLTITMPNGTTQYGWKLIVTLKNPLIGYHELHASAEIPVLTIPYDLAFKLIGNATDGLRDQREKIQRESLKGTIAPQ